MKNGESTTRPSVLKVEEAQLMSTKAQKIKSETPRKFAVQHRNRCRLCGRLVAFTASSASAGSASGTWPSAV